MFKSKSKGERLNSKAVFGYSSVYPDATQLVFPNSWKTTPLRWMLFDTVGKFIRYWPVTYTNTQYTARIRLTELLPIPALFHHRLAQTTQGWAGGTLGTPCNPCWAPTGQTRGADPKGTPQGRAHAHPRQHPPRTEQGPQRWSHRAGRWRWGKLQRVTSRQDLPVLGSHRQPGRGEQGRPVSLHWPQVTAQGNCSW